MRRKLPSVTALRAFEAAARHMSFARAAAELAVTPTAISHQVSQLEQSCGARLFRRRPRPLCLTEAGERLFPVLRDGFESFAIAVAAIAVAVERRPLRITATNAFAHRWLLPRLRSWRAAHPDRPIEIIATDVVLDLAAGQADIALRYARAAPPGLVAREVLRDRFWPMCRPALAGAARTPMRPAELLRLPLIHIFWGEAEPAPPSWEHWSAEARRRDPAVPPATQPADGIFREELHAIEAMLAGQGVALCSDVLLADELASGTVLRASDLSLPGYGLFLVHLRDHPQAAAFDGILAWLRAGAEAG